MAYLMSIVYYYTPLPEKCFSLEGKIFGNYRDNEKKMFEKIKPLFSPKQ